MNDYEQEREERIAENKKRIEELGLQQALSQVASAPSTSPPSQGRKRSRKQASPERQVRRSVRERKQVSYREPEYELLGQGPAATRRRLTVNIEDEEELASLRAAIATDPAEGGGVPKLRKTVDSGKGVRIQGGKVYDSKYGVTCHWCRQKTLENHVTCTRDDCGKGKRMPVTFCFSCLRNRHGEDGNLAHASKSWVCPPCRVNCGPGCVLCCNCGPCRKKAGLEPTHQVVKLARSAGYDNVHDYLVHLARPKEAPEEILARKTKFPWGQWMVAPQGEALAKGSGGEGHEGSEGNSEEAEETQLLQAPSVPTPISSEVEEQPRPRRGRAAKTLTDIFPVGKPRGSDGSTKAGSKRLARKQVEEEEEKDMSGSDQEAQDAIAPAVSNVAPPYKTPNTDGLTRKQRIQMSLGLGTIPISA